MQGAITPHLRGVTVDYNNQCLTLRAYFDSGAGDDAKELVDNALTEMFADLHNEIEKCRYEPVDLPFPGKMEMLKLWIYVKPEM